MNHLLLTFILSSIVLASIANAQLPQWSERELKAIETGQFIPGNSLFSSISQAELDKLDLIPNDLGDRLENTNTQIIPDKEILEAPLTTPPARPEPRAAHPELHQGNKLQDNHYFISKELIARYFEKPITAGLSDPQLILKNAERLDFQYSLEQYFDTSPVSIYLYLFDQKQKVPLSHSPKATFQEFYYSEPSAIVVYYFIGEPERTQVHFDGKETYSLTKHKTRTLAKNVKIAAKRHSNSINQLDEFIRQLSLHLFWIEKAMLDDNYEALHPNISNPIKQNEENSNLLKKDAWLLSNKKTLLFYSGLSLLVILLITVLLKRKRNFFPRLKTLPRLHLPNATFSGAQMKFEDEDTPPSQQSKDL